MTPVIPTSCFVPSCVWPFVSVLLLRFMPVFSCQCSPAFIFHVPGPFTPYGLVLFHFFPPSSPCSALILIKPTSGSFFALCLRLDPTFLNNTCAFGGGNAARMVSLPSLQPPRRNKSKAKHRTHLAQTGDVCVAGMSPSSSREQPPVQASSGQPRLLSQPWPSSSVR